MVISHRDIMIIMSLLSTEEGCNEKQYSITAPPLCPSSVLSRDVMKNSTALLRLQGIVAFTLMCAPLVALCPLRMPQPSV